MNRIVAGLATLGLLAPVGGHAQGIDVSSVEARSALVGPEQIFSGTAIIKPFLDPQTDTGAGIAEVTFAPGARTAWHTHPAGQALVVTDGVGWVQERGGERRTIRPGDVVWIAPGVEHWHGATSEHSMTHTAVQQVVDGSVVEWLDLVTDAEYTGG